MSPGSGVRAPDRAILCILTAINYFLGQNKMNTVFGNLQQIIFSLFMNGEGSIPSGHLMVRLGAYVIPMFPVFNLPGFPSLVKGGRLKIYCGCFVGSNPTPGIFIIKFYNK